MGTSFRETARWQGCCQSCGSTGAWQGHHVVERQELKRRGLPQNDRRNAFRICGPCHERHTNAFERIKLTDLRDENLEYAFDVLGAYAYDYLCRRYNDTALDPRMERHLAACT